MRTLRQDQKGLTVLIGVIIVIAITLAVTVVLIFSLAGSPRPQPPYAGTWFIAAFDPIVGRARAYPPQPIECDNMFLVTIQAGQPMDQAVHWDAVLGVISSHNLQVKLNGVDITNLAVAGCLEGDLLTVLPSGLYNMQPGDWLLYDVPTCFAETKALGYHLIEGDVISIYYLPMDQCLALYIVPTGKAA